MGHRIVCRSPTRHWETEARGNYFVVVRHVYLLTRRHSFGVILMWHVLILDI